MSLSRKLLAAALVLALPVALAMPAHATAGKAKTPSHHHSSHSTHASHHKSHGGKSQTPAG